VLDVAVGKAEQEDRRVRNAPMLLVDDASTITASLIYDTPLPPSGDCSPTGST
jgi:hypothetical protein